MYFKSFNFFYKNRLLKNCIIKRKKSIFSIRIKKQIGSITKIEKSIRLTSITLGTYLLLFANTVYFFPSVQMLAKENVTKILIFRNFVTSLLKSREEEKMTLFRFYTKFFSKIILRIFFFLAE